MTSLKRVLAIEDDGGVRDYLEAVVPRFGYEVSVAADAEEAFESVAKTPVDLIILDLVLPGMDGLEALRRFRQRLPDVPVVILSGHGQRHRIVDSIRLGAADFLQKPFELDEMERALRNALEQSGEACPTCRGTGRT